MNKRSDFNVELIRFFAVLAVILVHMSMGYFYTLLKDGDTFSWSVNSFYFSVTRFCVPVFFIVSAYLAFKYDSKRKWTERAIQLLIPYIAWSIIYFIFNGGTEIKTFFIKTLTATTSFHLWFIPAFIGYSILLPLIKACFTEENKKRFIHIPALVFFFTVVTPTIVRFLNQYTGTDYSFIYGINQFSLSLPAYLTYALCYPYLHKKINPVMGMAAFLAIVVFNWAIVCYLSIRNNIADESMYGFTTAIVFVSTYFLFNSLMSADFTFLNKHIASFIMSVGRCSFGIYLCHWFVFEILNRNGFILHGHPLSAPLVNTIIVFIISYLLVFIFKKIKYVNKIV